jgi:peptidyl-prolyl cis-trans isomerase C
MRRGLWIRRVGPAGWFILCLVGNSPGQESPTSLERPVPPVVAKVNGTPITAQVYERLWRKVTLERGAQGVVKAPDDREALKREVLDEVITLELLAQEANLLDVRVDPQEIEHKVREAEVNAGGKESLDQVLSAQGLTRQEFIDDLVNTLRIGHLLEKEVFDKVSVEPDQIRAYYESNLRVFRMPEQIRARHIFIRIDQEATAAQRKKALRAITRAAKRIQSAEPFDEVAKEVSQDRSASMGGDIGYVTRGQLPPQFEGVAFSLEAGQVSEVIETPLGYHLIKVDEKHPSRTLSLDEAEPRIRAYLRSKREEEALKRYTEGLWKEAKIEKADM